MSEFQYPYKDAEFILGELVGFDSLCETGGLEDINVELASAVLEEAARLAGEVVAPLNEVGDREGATVGDDGVRETPGFAEAYRQYVEGGWAALPFNEEYGGQGMPKVLGCVIEEMFWAANTSLYLYGTLTAGACICIDSHGSEEQKQTYLPKLYSGQWSGAMDLTEPHAGTDLGIIRTRAVPHADGSYRISGTKIFITSGEHDMAENIVHLVLAKLPDAPDFAGYDLLRWRLAEATMRLRGAMAGKPIAAEPPAAEPPRLATACRNLSWRPEPDRAPAAVTAAGFALWGPSGAEPAAAQVAAVGQTPRAVHRAAG